MRGRAAEGALALARRGWRVTPLHRPTEHGCSCRRSKCDSVGKHPLSRGWTTTASANPEVISGWWTAQPQANVGLATGQGSGVVVLDIDPRHGGDDGLRDLELTYSELPQTVEVITGGGGRGLVFRSPQAGARSTAGVIGPGLDVRGDGGLAVMPPSLHASGRRYVWSVDGHPDDVPVAEMPAWLVALLTQRTAKLQENDYRGEPIEEGRRNERLVSLAGSMRSLGLGADAIRAALVEHNAKMCRPPVEAAEIDRIVRSAAQWPIGPPWRRGTVPLLEFAAEATSTSTGLDRMRERLVLLVLAAHADDTGVCWPGYTRIEHLSGVHRRFIRPTLDRLEDQGVIEALRKNTGHVNRYRLRRPSA